MVINRKDAKIYPKLFCLHTYV